MIKDVEGHPSPAPVGLPNPTGMTVGICQSPPSMKDARRRKYFMVMIADYIAEHIQFLEHGDLSLNVKLERILQHEYRRKLARYQCTDRILSQKYQMDFETFRQRNMVAEHGYSFEVEDDASDWEIAVDGMMTMSRKLNDLTGKEVWVAAKHVCKEMNV